MYSRARNYSSNSSRLVDPTRELQQAASSYNPRACAWVGGTLGGTSNLYFDLLREKSRFEQFLAFIQKTDNR